VYYNVTVKDIIRETNDSISIVFTNPGTRIKYKPGQFISMILTIDGEEIRRSYSLCSSPDYDPDLAVTVKKIDKGRVSNYLVNRLKPGDEIKIIAPSGNFTTDFDPGNKRTFVFFAGGSGITPLISIMKSALIREPHSRIVLIYQNRSEDSIIFSKIIDEFANKYSYRVEVIHILSQPSVTWSGRKGRLNPDHIKTIFRDANIPLDNASVFVCGPKGMMEMVETTLDDMGFDKKNRFRESFYNPETIKEKYKKQNQEAETISESRVTILLDNEEYEIHVKADEFILENALDEDIDMPFSCQSGICTTCRGKLISGEVRMDDPEGLSEEEIESGYILTCISHPVSKDLKIEMG
jgi:ring-1,2-phenylacetyl-CoA epoxidase subunit PaaE